MIKRIKTIILGILASSALLLPVLAPAVVHAQSDITGNLCGGAQLSVSAGTNCTDPQAENKVNGIITFIINTFSIVVAIIAVIMIIIGGVKYITSGGDSTNVTNAKNTILYAIIGLVIVALSQILVKFVLNKVANS